MKKILNILLGVMMVLAVSCEMTPPTLSDSGTIPYQRPDTPSNVKVVSGNRDKIVITWDPVENASYYVIEGAVSSDFGERFSVFGNTTGTRFELDRGSEIRTDRSYLFTVRAVTAFSNGKTFVSLNSDYVEGALAPTADDIQFYSVVTSDTVTAYWNIPTFFPTLSSTGTLYDAAFTLGYRLASDESAPWSEIKDVEVDPDRTSPWMFHQIDINRGALKQNEEYLFRVGVDILAEDGSVITTAHSNPVKLLLHSDKLPSPIDRIDVKDNGLALDGIELSWKVPEWTLPLTGQNSHFRIERKEVGTDEWVKLVDETNKGDISPRIARTVSESTGEVSAVFKDIGYTAHDAEETDINVLKGKTFIYRITNAASEGGVVFVQDKGICETPEVSIFDTDLATKVLGWTTSGDSAATVAAEWTLTRPLEGTDLKLFLVTETQVKGSEEWKVLRTVPAVSGEEFSESYGEGTEDIFFRYSLQLRVGSIEGELYEDFGVLPAPGYEGTYPSLRSDKFPAPVTITDITAGTSADGITLTWTVPEWKLPLSSDGIFFRIERRKADAADTSWTVLVDEITPRQQVTDVTRSVSGDPLTGTASYTDRDLDTIRNAEFEYRVSYANIYNDILYVQTGEPVLSAHGYTFETAPVPGSMKLEWTPDPVQASAAMTFSWTFDRELIEGLVPVIVTQSSTKEEPGVWKPESVRDAVPSMVQDFGDGKTEKYFRYTLQLRKGSTEGEVYSSYGYFPCAGMDMDSGPFPTIGVESTTEPMIDVSSIGASDDRVGLIAVTFTETADNLRYTYSLDGGETFYDTEAKVLSGKTKEIAVPVSEKGEKSVIIRFQGGKLVYSAPAVTGSILDTPADLNLTSKVTDGKSVALSWNPAAAETDIGYMALCRAHGTEAWTELETVDFAGGSYTYDISQLEAGQYDWALRMHNTKHVAEGTADTVAASFDILPEVTGIKASKGSSKDGITVTWNAVDRATGYNVWRYADDIGAKTLAGTVGNVLTFTDTAAPAEARYTVEALQNENTGRLQTGFGTEKNPILNDEEANLGYRFGTAAFTPVSESHLTADDHLKEYFTVSFEPDRFIPVYTVSATADDISYEFDLSTFTESGKVRTNGKGAEEVGYAEYDPASNTFTANVRFGILDGKLAVNDVAVTGRNGSIVTDRKNSTGDTFRAPGAADCAVMFNNELRNVISAAGSYFGGDWYGGTGAGDWKQRTYTGTNVKVGNTYADNWAGNQGNNGYIRFSGYAGTAMTLTTVTDIKIVSTNGGKAGYLDADPLNIVGTNGSGNKTTAVMTVNNTVGGKKVVYDEVSVRVNGITKYPGDDTSRTNWQGGYGITIGSGPEVNVPITDLKVKPY